MQVLQPPSQPANIIVFLKVKMAWCNRTSLQPYIALLQLHHISLNLFLIFFLTVMSTARKRTGWIRIKFPIH